MSSVAILGAGIAGLSAGWLLKHKGISFAILEKQSYVGGLARSFSWHGFDCDFAAHRLFTTDDAVLQQLLELVPMGRHIRRSQISLAGRWLRDPLDVFELGLHLPLRDSLQILWAYLTRPRHLSDGCFEDYVVRRYGKHLYEVFFRPYTEKLFGISGREISALWASQKVRLANPLDVLRNSTKTKFNYFYYPRRGGYGAIAERLYSEIKQYVLLESVVTGLENDGGRISGVRYVHGDQEQFLPVEALVSTLPLTVTGRMLGRRFNMHYQKVDAIYLWLNRPWLTDKHWLYFVDDAICINRLVEFKNMSAENAPGNTTVVCAEVTQRHEDVGGRVVEDLARMGLISPDEVLDCKIVREEFAYPVYDRAYDQSLQQARQDLARYKNLHLVGRAAEFRHREVDDNFAAAADAVRTIVETVPEAPMETQKRIPQPPEAQPRPTLVYGVILALNNYEDTRECLQSVLASDYPALRLVLVDNGSSDGTSVDVRHEFPQVHVIETGQNLGVPAGYNVGFAHALAAGAAYVLLLNNDTTVAADMVTCLVTAAEADPQAGILMPKVLVYGSDTKFWSIGGYYRSFPPAIVMTEKRKELAEVPRMIEFAPGCGLLIHRRAFERAGLFDPGYLFWYDDWDFCERVRAYGLHIQYLPTARMWHKVSRTTGGGSSPLFWHTYAASAVRFYRRHGRPVWFTLTTHLAYIIWRDIIWRRKWSCWREFAKGIRDGLSRPLGELPNVLSSLPQSDQ